MAEALAAGVIDTLVETGAFVDFYGAAECQFKLGIDGAQVAFEVLEDEEDGYRSSLGTFCIAQDHETIFFKTPIAKVKVVRFKGLYKPEEWSSEREADVWRLVDADGHQWLEWGTDNSDDYYPSFVFYYEPKEQKANG